MTMNHEQEAQNLENALKQSAAECHDPALLPFVQTSDSLKREAAAPSERLSPEVAAKQRANLMSMAQKQSENAKEKQASPVPADGIATMPEKPKSGGSSFFNSRNWMVWSGSFAAVAAVIVLAVFVFKSPQVRNIQTGLPAITGEQIARLIIPEAHAGDAFSVIALEKDKTGVETTTGFMVSSTVPVTIQELEQHLKIVPAADDANAVRPDQVKIVDVGNGSFRVEPGEPLSPGKVYNVKIDTAIKKADGTLTAHEFSWAVQTKSVFRVMTSVPADRSSGVPTKTGIEFGLSYENWVDPAPFFAIEPAVPGRFEVHNRSLTFVPLELLKYGQVYTVTLKKGFSVKDTQNALAQDFVMRFETVAAPKPGDSIGKPVLTPMSDMNEELPGRDPLIPVYWSGETTSTPVAVTGYLLDPNQAKQYLQERTRIPDFAIVNLAKPDLYAKYATKKVFEVKGALEQTNYYGYNVRLPGGVPAGRYLLKFQADKADASWTFFESTNLVSYSVADKSTLAIWAVNAETRRPLSDIPVVLDSSSVRTDSSGIARLPTPNVLVTTSTFDQTPAIVVVGDGDLSSVIRIQKQYMPWTYYGNVNAGENMNDRTVSFLYPDRPLYRTTDSLKAYGLARDRQGKQAVSSGLTLELSKGGYYYDYFSGEAKVYQRVEVKTDAEGFFQTDMSWKQLQAGTYRIDLKRDGKLISTRNFEVKDFVKPAYSLEIAVDKKQIFAGEDITGEVRAVFYSGAPVSNLDVSLGVSGAADGSLSLKTDDDGRATFSFKTSASKCDTYSAWSYCGSANTAWLSANPTDSEEAQTVSSETVNVWRSRVALSADRKVSGDKADIEFTVRNVDLSQIGNSEWNVLGTPRQNAKVTGKIVERHWEAINEGTGYDYIEKTTYPIYRYEMKERDVGTVDVTTDTEGKAHMQFAMTSTTVSYQLFAETKDENGVSDFATTYFSRGWWDYDAGSYSNDEEISLKPLKEDPNNSGYKANETVQVGMFKGRNPLPDSDTPTFLFVQSHLGIKDLAVSQKSTYSFTFGDDNLPNTMVRGVMFVKDGFVQREFTATFDQTDRQVTVNITKDQDSYAPGGKAKLHVSLKSNDGTPVKGARIDLALVDEAVFAAAQRSINEDPLADIYAWVSDGVIFDQISHFENKNEAAGYGGAEMGGGGGEQIRRNFKDTAAFTMVTADDNGQADITVDLPDNLTSWRATAVAATPGLYAGVGRTQVRVTKPVFVEATLPGTLLVQDKPVIKLRAYGTGLKTGEDVEFSVESPTLGLKGEKVKGKAGTPTFVTVDTLPAGDHAMIVRVKGSNGSDAMEKKVSVLVSRFVHNELAKVDLGPGVSFPDIGQSREVKVKFLPKTRAQYLERVRELTWTWSQRLESRLASRLAKDMLKDYFGETPEGTGESLSKFQQPGGGLAILPYASDDAELTSKVAAIAPDLFDRQGLETYLTGVLQNKDITREEQLRALSGLAALGAPVLQQLQDMAALNDLNWHEKLAVMRGLQAIGDKGGAHFMLQDLLAQAKEADGLMSINVADDKRSVTEATAEAAAVAADLLDPSAPKLDAWLEKNWTQDTLTDLDRVAYLEHVVPAALGSEVTIGYTLGGAPEQTIKLKESWGERLTLTADEAKSFRITKADGPAVAVFYRSIPGLPQTSPDVQITRSYQDPNASVKLDLKESDVVTVYLDLKWNKLAQSGCYTVRDYLPAGLAPMVSVYFDWYNNPGIWYPSDIDGNAVSFVACNPGEKEGSNRTIKYRARVVSRGTYLAEPAIMQSMVAPSISALSGSQSVTIK